MNEMTVFIIVVVLAILPIVAIAAFLLSAWWKKVDRNRIMEDLPDYLMVIGGTAFLGFLLTLWASGAFTSQEQYLSEPKTIVSGTIEEAEHHMIGRMTEILSVKVDGKWYSLILPWGSDSEITAEAGAWMEESIGQTAELTVYSTPLWRKEQELLMGGYINRGEIFGVRDGEGAVLLDADDCRLDRYLTEHDGIELAVGVILFSALLFVVGLILKLTRKR